MKAKRAFYILVTLLVLTITAAAAGVYYGNEFLQQEAGKLVSLKLHNQALNEQQSALTTARQDVARYDELNRIAQVIVPQEKDQATTVSELVDLARKANIKIGSITFPASNLGTKGVAGSTSTSPKSLSQVVAVPGIAGVYQMPITIQSDTSAPTDFGKLIAFMDMLEKNRHTAQVTQVAITPADGNGKRLTFVLTLNVYIKP